MDNFWMKFLINFVIGVVAIVGFFIFWGRSSGWFKEGGIVYEYYKNKKNRKNKRKKNNKNI